MAVSRNKRVPQQHSNCHWTDTARYRGDRTRDFARAAKVDVPDKPALFLARFGWQSIDPDIDHRRTGFEPFGLDHFCSAYRSDNDICAAHDSGQILRAAMSDGDRGISIEQQLRHRLPDNVGAANDNRLKA